MALSPELLICLLKVRSLFIRVINYNWISSAPLLLLDALYSLKILASMHRIQRILQESEQNRSDSFRAKEPQYSSCPNSASVRVIFIASRP